MCAGCAVSVGCGLCAEIECSGLAGNSVVAGRLRAREKKSETEDELSQKNKGLVLGLNWISPIRPGKSRQTPARGNGLWLAGVREGGATVSWYRDHSKNLG